MLYGKRTVAIVSDATDGVQIFAKLGVCEPYPKSENSTNHAGTCPRCAKPRLEYNPIKKFTKCFNEECGFGGGIIQTVMEVKGCTDDEALEYLAREAGVKLPEKKEKRQLFGFFKDSIPYYRGLRDVAGSLPAAVLMGQLEYWFERKPSGFYKFLLPAPNHPAYKKGDSWTEELNISASEFRTAFDKIGKRYPTKKSFDAMPPDDVFFKSVEDEYLYCSYFDKIRGTTKYFRNGKVDSIINELLTTGAIKLKKIKADAQVKKIKTKTGATLFVDQNGRFVSVKR